MTSFSALVFFFLGIVLIPAVVLFWHRRQLSLLLITILSTSLVIRYQVEQNIKREQHQSQQLIILRQLSTVAAQLEGNLLSSLSLLSGFSAYISATPDLSDEDFRCYAREIFKNSTLFINFAAAKDLVVNYVYPLAGNENVIGLDYRAHPAQRDMVMQVVDSGQSMVVGPVDLVQGGVAFISRTPIFTGEGSERRLWGIISSPLDAASLLEQSGVYSYKNTMELAIRNFDTQGQEGAVLFGPKDVFLTPGVLLMKIHVGGGYWQLGAIPRQIDKDTPSIIITIRTIILITTLLLCAYVIYRFRQEKEKRLLENKVLEHQRLLEMVGSVANIGGWKVDYQFNVIQWSEQTSKVLQLSDSHPPRTFQGLSSLIEENSFALWQNKMERLLLDKIPFDIDIKLNNGDLEKGWIRVIADLKQDNGLPVISGTLQDVSDKVLSSKIIEYQASYDTLTDLPNRTLFNSRLQDAIKRSNRYGGLIAVLFIDLDRFKLINDNHGHIMGDKLLVNTAQRIHSCVRDTDTVSRLSGDEFGVIVVNLKNASNALQITEQIQRKLETPYEIDNLAIYCSASIGIALYPQDGIEAQLLLSHADQAMYEVKKSGRNGWQFYTAEMQRQSEYRHRLLNELISAIDNNHLIPYFQPIFDIQHQCISHCEILTRWQLEGQFVPPGEFISLAEESGLVNKIDLQVLIKSANIMKKINATHHQNIGISINVSPRLFQTKDHSLKNWMDAIKQHCRGLNITVEITERLLMEDFSKAVNILKELRSNGVTIAIDDFGSGYSSLSYLIKFPVDIIKIDRVFIDTLSREKSSETLVETILLMGQKLGIQVVAEGIETQEQLQFLRTRQCGYGQGYYLSKPMNQDDFIAFITQHGAGICSNSISNYCMRKEE